MLKSINQAGSVYVAPLPQNEGTVPQNYQVSYMGNVNFERNPVTDDFYRQNSSGTGAATTALGLLGTLALIFAGFSLHKGTKVLKGKNSSLLEKLKTGSKELINDAKKLFARKTKNASGDFEEIAEGTKKRTNDTFVKKPQVQSPRPKSRTFETSGVGRRQPKPEYQAADGQSLQRQSFTDKIRELFWEKPTKKQQLEINRNNREAREAFSKSRRIGESIPEDVAEKLRSMHSAPVPAPKAASKVKQTVVISKPVKETKIKRPVRLKSKRSDYTTVPKKAAQKPLKRSDIQIKVIGQANPKAAKEIKSLEGNIRRIEKQIEGAKKFGKNKNTAALERNLETNKKKLAKLKSETFDSIETVQAIKEPKKQTSHITSKRSERPKERNVIKSVSKTEPAKVNPEYVRAKAETAQRDTGYRPAETIRELANTPFDKISGVKEGSGLIRQYDAKGRLLRCVRDRGKGIVEVTEYSGHNPNGISYYMRDGMIIKKSDIGKQSDNMRRLVHNLEGVKDKDEIKRIVGSYADRYGLKEVNDTVMLGGKQVKVIYRGFEYDVTAEGRVISRKYAADGTCTFNVDVTKQLSRKIPEKTNLPMKHRQTA